MILAFLLLAQVALGPQAIFYTEQDVRNPDRYITKEYSTIYSMPRNNRPDRAAALLGLDDIYPNQMRSQLDQSWDRVLTGPDAQFLQRSSFIQQPGGSTIRTTLPDDQIRTMTLEDEMAMEEANVQRLERTARVRGALLQQRMQAADHQYKLNTIEQSEQLLQELGSGKPGEPNYLEWRAGLARKFPLGVQNQSILRNLEMLDNTHEQISQSDAILNRQKQLNAESDRQRDISEGRRMAAKLGTRALAHYEDELARDPQVSPLGLVAKMAEAQDEQNTVTSLRNLGLDDEKVQSFYVDEVDFNGRPTGRKILNAAKAKDYMESYPSEANVSRAIQLKAKIRENNFGRPFEQWSPEDQVDWNVLNNQVRRYEASIGQKTEQPKQPGEIPNTPKASMFFRGK